ncbi:MAG: LacI family transcriptional regulator [Chlorobi bacterium]|nr:LacI family transcriptional regulator [Chlorobiota bacterium]
MESGRYTIKDIAKQLGISPSTVSRALKDHPDISKKTKKVVSELAAKLHYRPNAIALSLRNKKSKIIGVIIPEMVHYFFSTIISGIEKIAHEQEYQVMVCQSNEVYQQEVENAYALLSSRIDGLLVAITKETSDSTHFQDLINQGVPIVFFDRMMHNVKSDKVIVDDHDGAYKAVEHLINIGKKKIAHFAGPQNRLIGMNRQNGYVHALQDYKIPVDKEMIFDCDSYKKALELTEQLFKTKNIPDAIFAANDLTAIGAMKIIKDKGLKIPDDVAVIGFGNSFYSQISDPALTTVSQPGYEMGKLATELLFNRLNSTDEKAEEPQLKVLKTKLIIRDSTVIEKK